MNPYVYRCIDLCSGAVLADLPFTVSSLPQVLASDIETTFTLDMSDGGRDPAGNLKGISKLNPVNATIPGRCGIFALRDGQPVWGGIVWARSYDSTTKQWTITAATAESYWRHRYAGSNNVWTGADQYTILVELFSEDIDVLGQAVYYQTSDGAIPTSPSAIPLGTAGITDFDGTVVYPYPTIRTDIENYTGSTAADGYHYAVTIASGIVRPSYTIAAGKCIYDAVSELAVLADGFEWNFDPAVLDDGLLGWKFRVGSPQRGRSEAITGLNWSYGDAQSNIISYTQMEDARGSSNLTVATGQEYAGKVLGVAYGELASLRNGYPLIMGAVNNPDAITVPQLLAAAHGGMVSAPIPVTTPGWIVRSDIEPTIGSYALGDRAVFAISDERTPRQTDGTAGAYSVERIVKIDIQPPQRDQIEQVTLTTNPASPSSPRLPAAQKRRLDDLERRIRALQITAKQPAQNAPVYVSNPNVITIPASTSGSPGAYTLLTQLTFIKQADFLHVYVQLVNATGVGTNTHYWNINPGSSPATGTEITSFTGGVLIGAGIYNDRLPIPGAYGDLIQINIYEQQAAGSPSGTATAQLFMATQGPT